MVAPPTSATTSGAGKTSLQPRTIRSTASSTTAGVGQIGVSVISDSGPSPLLSTMSTM